MKTILDKKSVFYIAIIGLLLILIIIVSVNNSSLKSQIENVRGEAQYSREAINRLNGKIDLINGKISQIQAEQSESLKNYQSFSYDLVSYEDQTAEVIISFMLKNYNPENQVEVIYKTGSDSVIASAQLENQFYTANIYIDIYKQYDIYYSSENNNAVSNEKIAVLDIYKQLENRFFVKNHVTKIDRDLYLEISIDNITNGDEMLKFKKVEFLAYDTANQEFTDIVIDVTEFIKTESNRQFIGGYSLILNEQYSYQYFYRITDEYGIVYNQADDKYF